MERQQFGETPRTMIFYHIPKTAGTSFRSAVIANFPAKDLHLIDGSELGNEPSIAKFKSLPQSKRDRIKFLFGHNTWGLDSYFSHPCTYITFLRDPFKRTISEYYHLLRKPGHLEQRRKIKAEGYTLRDYFEYGHVYYGHNRYIKLLIQKRDRDYQVTEQDYARAVELLEKRFSGVGITDRFDESLLLFSHVLGSNINRYARGNTAQNYDRQAVDTAELRTLCDELNKYDILLYEHFRKRFEAQLSEVCNLDERLSVLRENVRIYTASERRRFSAACRVWIKKIVRRSA